MPHQPHHRIAPGVTGDREAALTLRFVTDGATALVQVCGDLDMETCPLLTELINHVMALHRPPLLVLDLHHLDFLCAAGIHALLQARETALTRHAHLILRDPPPLACDILTITETLDLFDIQAHDHRPAPRLTRASSANSTEPSPTTPQQHSARHFRNRPASDQDTNPHRQRPGEPA